MAQDPINLGTAENSGNGDKVRVAFGKVNAMFAEVYASLLAFSTHVHAAATSTVAGFMGAADKAKLDGIASGATANQTDTYLRARANQTGTQPSNTISDFAESVDDRVAALLVAGSNVTLIYDDAAGTLAISAAGASGTPSTAWADITGKPATFAPAAHSHAIADVTSLQATLDGKAASVHVHADVIAAGASGFMSGADKTKLNGVATGATANATDALLRDRTTHTGAQAISTVTGLQTALDAKAATSHAHVIADTTGLQAALDGKAATTHTHADATTSASGFMPAASVTKLAGIATGATANASDAQLRDRSTHTGTQAQATVTDLPAALAARITSDTTLAGGGTAYTNAVWITRAAYAAIVTKHPTTKYDFVD